MGSKNPCGIYLLLWLLIMTVVVVPTACGEEDPLNFTGTPGSEVPMTLSAWVPLVPFGVNLKTDLLALVDTGSPMTLVSSQVGAQADGIHHLDLQGFGLGFPDFRSVVQPLPFEDNACEEPTPQGLLGGDLFRHFSLGIDYQRNLAFLFDPGMGDEQLAHDTNPFIDVPVTILGGGMARLDDLGGATLSIPPTRVVVADVSVEGVPAKALVDTGASLTAISPTLLDGLKDPKRPELCCLQTVMFDGLKDHQITRLKELRLGAAVVTDSPVMVMEDNELFKGLAQEIGQTVDLLVGGSFLRHFAVRFDYRAQRLRLFRYRQENHIPQGEFISPGFTFCKARAPINGHLVVDVFKGTLAAQQGVTPGVLLLSVDGQAVESLSATAVEALLRRKAPGSTVAFGFAGEGGKKATLSLPVQDLLPSYR